MIIYRSPLWDKLGQLLVIALAFMIPISTCATTLLMMSIVLCWLCGPNQSLKRNILLHHPLMGWIYLLVLLTVIGITYSLGDSVSIRRGLIDGLRLGLIPILLYFYQPKSVSRFALWAFTGAMILTLILAYLKVYGGLPIGLKYTTGAIFKSHIKTSFFMAIAVFFIANECKNTKRYRLPLIILSGLMIYYLLFMSMGRIGYITLVLCLLMLSWQWYRVKGILWASLLAVVLMMGAYFTSSVFSERINLLSQDLDFYHQGGRLIESSLGSRLQFAKSSMSLITENPILGSGTGSFGAVYAQKHQGENTLLTDNPHNEYLRIGVELGFLGIVCLLFLFYRQWKLGALLPQEYRHLNQGVLLTFVLGCLFNSWLKDFTEAYFYCVMTAIFFGALPLPQRQSSLKATMH